MLPLVSNSQLETETNEKLQNIYTKLLTAGTEAKQSDKEKRLKETIDTLKNIYPGQSCCFLKNAAISPALIELAHHLQKYMGGSSTCASPQPRGIKPPSPSFSVATSTPSLSIMRRRRSSALTSVCPSLQDITLRR